jgi:hypothetical protein
MTPTDYDSFDDPVLKDAVRRAWGSETAPAALRERVVALGIGAAKAPLAAVTPAVAANRRGWWTMLRHPNSIYGLAAAAMIVIGFAIGARLNVDSPRRFGGGSDGQYPVAADYGPAAPILPVPVLKGVLDVHDASRSNPASGAQFKDVPPGDFDALRKRMGRELGFKALAAPLADDDGPWAFRGASVCEIGRFKASHLVFERGGEMISVFSLPRSSCPDARIGRAYKIDDPDHPLVVFVRSDGVHFVVGSSEDRSLSPDDLLAVCERLRAYLGR